jgi:hypothetical protein
MRAGSGLNPVITVTEVYDENGSVVGKQRFFELLAELGVTRPRLKILPVFAPEDGWDHLQCSACRMVTDQGVWVCPILVNEPGGKMGSALADTLDDFALSHPACWTCHAYGVTCKT